MTKENFEKASLIRYEIEVCTDLLNKLSVDTIISEYKWKDKELPYGEAEEFAQELRQPIVDYLNFRINDLETQFENL